MKSYMAKKGELPQQWVVVDVADQILGRAAVKIATMLMGKHRPEYTPHVDVGDFVVVLNAAKVKTTGGKQESKSYDYYTKYPGGRKVIPMADMLRDNPEQVVIQAVKRMLPKSKLGAAMLSKLKVYPGAEHPHQAQNPAKVAI